MVIVPDAVMRRLVTDVFIAPAFVTFHARFLLP
jgi:hypothetical protein